MNNTVRFEPAFRVDGNDVPANVMAHDVLTSYFKTESFKDVAAKTLSNSDVEPSQFDEMLSAFDEYIRTDIVKERVAHDLMGEFFQTYQGTELGLTKVIHGDAEDVVQVRFDISLDEAATDESRAERKALSMPSYDDVYDDEDFDDDEFEL